MELKMDLRSLHPDGGHLDAEQNVAVSNAEGAPVAVACRVAVDYRSTGASWFFHVTVSGVLDAVCDRCVAPVALEVSGTFELTVRRSNVGEAPEPGVGYIILGAGENEILLDELIREAFIVNIPMQVLCTDSCRGLCPQCGINLNQQTCTCQSAGDSRWDALKRLQDDGGNP